MESLRMMVGQKVGVRRMTYFLSCPFFLHPTGINLLAYIFLNAIQISMNLFLQVTFEPVLSGSVLRGHLCYLVKVPNFFPIVTVILSTIWHSTLLNSCGHPLRSKICLYCLPPVLNRHVMRNHANETKNNLSNKI